MLLLSVNFFPQGVRGPRGSPGKPGEQGPIVSQSNRDDKDKRDGKIIHCFNIFCDILALCLLWRMYIMTVGATTVKLQLTSQRKAIFGRTTGQLLSL